MRLIVIHPQTFCSRAYDCDRPTVAVMARLSPVAETFRECVREIAKPLAKPQG
jgi:hypothetical protein